MDGRETPPRGIHTVPHQDPGQAQGFHRLEPMKQTQRSPNIQGDEREWVFSPQKMPLWYKDYSDLKAIKTQKVQELLLNFPSIAYVYTSGGGGAWVKRVFHPRNTHTAGQVSSPSQQRPPPPPHILTRPLPTRPYRSLSPLIPCGPPLLHRAPITQNDICFSPTNLPYVSLILRSPKEPKSKERTISPPLVINLVAQQKCRRRGFDPWLGKIP